MFARLGWLIAKHPVWIIASWVMLACLFGMFGPSPEVIAELEPPSLLPADQPYNVSLRRLSEAFPGFGARTHTVIILERPEGLNEVDRAYMRDLTKELQTVSKDRWRVMSPADQKVLESRLLSEDGQSAMILASHNMNFITKTSTQWAEEIAGMAAKNQPDGLQVEITGEGGMGRDIGKSTTQAYHRTTWVTVVGVLVILILVYRAPMAAMVPLLSIGISVFVSLRFLDCLAALGEEVSDMERLFTVVLLFGSGIDFAMLWMARYWEKVEEEVDSDGITPLIRQRSIGMASAETGAAIVASAATTIMGFTMLLAADLSPIHTAGAGTWGVSCDFHVCIFDVDACDCPGGQRCFVLASQGSFATKQ